MRGLVATLLLWGVACAAQAQPASPDAVALLRKIYQATEKLSYTGTFVYQQGDRTEPTMGLDPLADKFRAFGFDTFEVDGHDLTKLEAAVEAALSGGASRATAIICDTVIGKGVPAFQAHPYPHYINAERPVWDEALRHLRSVAPEG